MKLTPALIAEIRALRLAWRKSDDAYRSEPFALTRWFNDNDAAAERMRVRRAKDQP